MAVIDSVHASRTSFTVDTLLSVKTVPTIPQSTRVNATRCLSLVIAGKKRLNRVLEGSLLAWNAHDLFVHSLHHANLANDIENARFTRSSAICFNSGTDTLKRARMNLLYILYSRNDSEFTGNAFSVIQMCDRIRGTPLSRDCLHIPYRSGEGRFVFERYALPFPFLRVD